MDRETKKHPRYENKLFKDMGDLSKYRRGATIVVNVEGDWVMAELTKDIVDDDFDKKQLKLDVLIDGQNKIIQVSETPHIINAPRGATFDDPKLGTFQIKDVHVTEGGRVEYTVVESGGKEHIGVPQELMNAWSENVALERRFDGLQNELANLPAKKQLELTERNKAIHKMIAELFALIPDVDEMAEQNKKQIKRLESRVVSLSEQASSALEDLQKNVREILATMGTSSTSTVDYHHVQTEAERQAELESAAEENKKNAEHAKDLRQDIDEQIKREAKDIDREKEQQLEDLKNTKEQEYKDAKKKLKADMELWIRAGRPNPKGKSWLDSVGASRLGEPVRPTKVDRDKVKLPAKEIRKFEKQKENVRAAVYYDFLTRAHTGQEDIDIVAEVAHLRKEALKKDRFIKAKDVDGDDYKFPGDAQKYAATRHFEVSTKILDDLLEERTKGVVSSPQAEKIPDGKEVFDFDKLHNGLIADIDTVVGNIPLKDDGTPEDAYEDIYNRLKQDKKDMEEEYPSFTSVEAAKAAGMSFLNTSIADQRQELQKDRENMITYYKEKIEKYKEQIDEIELIKKQKEAKAEVDESYKTAEATAEADREKRGDVIDIPEYIMRELLNSRQVEVEKAVRSLFSEGTIDENTGNISAEALDMFKDVFDGDHPPDAATLEKLRDSGIKDWGKFKELWDEKLAAESVRAMNEMAKAVVRRNIAENITWRDKLNKNIGHLLGRATMTMLLVGGGAAAVSALTGGLGIAGLGAVAGGAAGGGVRGWLNKKIFGSAKSKEKQVRLQKELEDTKRDDVVDGMVEQIMRGMEYGDPIGTSVAKSRLSPVSLEGLPSFAGILAQTMRDITTEMVKLDQDEPAEAKFLEGNARILYERALAHLETQNPDAETKKKLAIAISKMNGSGDRSFDEMKSHTDPKIMGILESAVSAYSGKKGIAASAFMGGIVGGAFFANNEYARATMGAVFGAVKGYESGKAADLRVEQQHARRKVYGDMNYLRDNTESLLKGDQKFADLSSEQKENLRTRLVNIKRLLLVNVTDRSELAIFGIAGMAPENVYNEEENTLVEKGDFVDFAGNVIITESGEIKSSEVRALMQDMRAVVTDAERAGIMFEEERDRKRIDRVLEVIQARTQSIEEEHEKTTGGWWGRNKNKVLRTLGGAVAGAASALLLGKIATVSRDYIKEDLLGFSESRSVIDTHEITEAAAAKGNAEWAEMERQRHIAESQQENIESQRIEERQGHRGIDTTIEKSYAPEIEKVPEIEKIPQVRSLNIQEIHKGEGILHGVNRALRVADGDNEILSHMNKSELHAWKMQELKDMGFVFKGGKWGYPISVRPGAQVELYADPEGRPHFRVIGEEGKTVVSYRHAHFRGETHAGAFDHIPEAGSKSVIVEDYDDIDELDKEAVEPLSEADTKIGVTDEEMDDVLDMRGSVSDVQVAEADIVPSVKPVDIDVHPKFVTPEQAALDRQVVATSGLEHTSTTGAEVSDTGAEEFVITHPAESMEDVALAATYKAQLDSFVGEFEAAVDKVNDGGLHISDSVHDKILAEINLANNNKIPSELQRILETNPDAAREYIINHLDPDEQLLFADVDYGTLHTDTAPKVLLGEDGLAVKARLLNGKEHIFRPPEGWTQFVSGVDDELYLKNGDNMVQAEIYTIDDKTLIRPVAERSS